MILHIILQNFSAEIAAVYDILIQPAFGYLILVRFGGNDVPKIAAEAFSDPLNGIHGDGEIFPELLHCPCGNVEFLKEGLRIRLNTLQFLTVLLLHRKTGKSNKPGI